MPIPLLLHGKHSSDKVSYEPFGPWLLPWRFQPDASEYQSLRASAGLIDYSTQALIEVRGADRADFLQRLLTNDVSRLSPGSGSPSALLDSSARLIAPLLVLADADALWLLCDLGEAENLLKTLQDYLFAEDVLLKNHERQFAALAIQGPETMRILSQILDSPLAFSQPLSHALLSLKGLPVRWIKHSLAGEAGVLGLVAAEEAQTVWSLLSAKGIPLGLVLCGWEALNTARIEAGLPWWGIDYDPTNLLPETGLESQLVSQTKGCYVGQEIVARLQTYGSPSKKLMGLRGMRAGSLPQAGDEMVQGEVPMGRITSACYSPLLREPVAMGYLKRGAYAPGTPIAIRRSEELLPATVTALPFLAER